MTTVLEEIQQTPKPLVLQILQQQEQQQRNKKRRKWLTIDQIMPKWSHLLDLLNAQVQDHSEIASYACNNNLYMDNYHRCMVGEAHRFDSDYAHEPMTKYCSYCVEYADAEFMDLRRDIENLEYVGKDWRQTKTVRDFVRHWNTKTHRDA